jgi:hypothetical protein
MRHKTINVIAFFQVRQTDLDDPARLAQNKLVLEKAAEMYRVSAIQRRAALVPQAGQNAAPTVADFLPRLADTYGDRLRSRFSRSGHQVVVPGATWSPAQGRGADASRCTPLKRSSRSAGWQSGG